MNIRKLMCALLAALLCMTLLCTAMAEAITEVVIDAEIPTEAVLEADGLELDGDLDAAVEALPCPDLDLDVDLALDDSLTGMESTAVELETASQANDGETGETVPLTVTYYGPRLTKPYDCTNKIYKVNESGTTVYAITPPDADDFTLEPASGYNWVDGHDDVRINVLSLKLNPDGSSRDFAGSDVGKYTLNFTFGLSGADAAYYACQTVRIPARILPREVVITPRPNMGKTFNDEPFRDPVFKQGTLLFKNITDPDSPYYVDVSGVPGYGVPVFTDSDREVLKLLATEAVLKSRPMFPGWLSREAGEDVGTYRITIGDMDFGDNFTVTLGEEYFTITPRSLDDAAITADPIPDQAYTGKYLKPVPNLEYDGETMIAGKDFTLAYSNNKKPGEATVTVTGKGNYTGRLKLSFNIVQKGAAISRLTAGRNRVTVSWKKISGVTGYQIAYSRYASFSGQVKKSVKGASKTALVVKGLRARTTYYFRIRTYKTSGGRTTYSAWSAAKKVTVK